jgi:hypothetical protein
MHAPTSSNRELARQLGVSETAVRRAEKAGRIARDPDGSWDLARVKAAWSDNTNQAQQRPAQSGGRTGKHRALKPVPRRRSAQCETPCASTASRSLRAQ